MMAARRAVYALELSAEDEAGDDVQKKTVPMLRRLLNIAFPRGQSLWLALAFSMLNSGCGMHRQLFTSFHMKMYLEVYQIGAAAVAGVHLVFAFVNPANDIVGAIASDGWAAKHSGSRLGMIAALCAVWPVATVLPFWPALPRLFGPVRAALLGLCVEDTIFSFAAIAIGACWTDATRDEGERVRMARLNMLAQQLLQSVMAGAAYGVWARSTEHGTTTAARGAAGHAVEGFASFATGVGLAGTALAFSGLFWLRRLLLQRPSATVVAPHAAAHGSGSGGQRLIALVVSFVRVALRHRNFWLFTVMSVLNEFLATFTGEFSPILTDIFLRGKLNTAQRATYLSAEVGCVAVSSLVCSALAQWRGVRATYTYTTLARAAVGGVCLLLPPTGVVGATVLLVGNMATGGSGALWAVLIASVADEHRALASNGGTRPAASVISLLYGLHAVLAKPTCSIAPVLGSFVLDRAGWTGSAMSGDVTAAALAAAYRLVCSLPLVCGAVQLLAWRHFDLDATRLEEIARPDRLVRVAQLCTQSEPTHDAAAKANSSGELKSTARDTAL